MSEATAAPRTRRKLVLRPVRILNGAHGTEAIIRLPASSLGRVVPVHAQPRGVEASGPEAVPRSG